MQTLLLLASIFTFVYSYIDFDQQRRAVYDQVSHLIDEDEFWTIARRNLQLKRKLFEESSYYEEVFPLNSTSLNTTNSTTTNQTDEHSLSTKFITLPSNGEMGERLNEYTAHNAWPEKVYETDLKTDMEALMGTKKPHKHDPNAPSPLKPAETIPRHKTDPAFQTIGEIFGNFFGFKWDLNEDYINSHWTLNVVEIPFWERITPEEGVIKWRLLPSKRLKNHLFHGRS